MKRLKFIKESDCRWFVELPEWKGDKDDLEMVMGADTMLDYISPDKDEVIINFSTKPFDNYNFKLKFINEIFDGGLYNLTGDNLEIEVWLCHVTKFVFGCFPKIIYLK